jgi:hypothetical protein
MVPCAMDSSTPLAPDHIARSTAAMAAIAAADPAVLEARIAAPKLEAIRRDLRRAEGEDFRITLTPPGISQRIDAATCWSLF